MKHIFLPEHGLRYKIFFLSFFFLFLIHQCLQKVLYVSVPVMDDFLDSFLFLPLVSHILLMQRYWFFGLRHPFSFYTIIAAFVLISIISEVAFPWLSSRFTADEWDVLSFALGGLVYYGMQQAGHRKQQ